MFIKISIRFFLFLGFFLAFSNFFITPAIAKEASIPHSKDQKNNSPIIIHVFERDDCKHCKDQKEFLNKLSDENNSFTVVYHNILKDELAQKQWKEIASIEKLPLATPITLIGRTVLQGFDTAETTGIRIKEITNFSYVNDISTPDVDSFIQSGGSGNAEKIHGGTCSAKLGEDCGVLPTRFLVSLPFFGPTDVLTYSLPVMSFILGFIDGFNPCAMWVLVTFLIVLTQVGDRKRMVFIVGLFILAEAIMYYMILNIWFTTWNFVGLDHIITPIIGFVSIGGGLFFLYEYRKNTKTCVVTTGDQQQKIVSRIRFLAEAKFTPFVIFSIIMLAFSVNIIEFACSIGIPQTFTKILEINNLSFIKEQGYMGIYIFAYILDDLIVFSLALWSINKITLAARYSRWSNLIGGILMILLGFILIFKPELLRFI